MNQLIIIIGAIIAGYYLIKVIRAIIQKRREKDVTIAKAAAEVAKESAEAEPRVDKKAAETWSPKSLGGQPLYYNEVDHTSGRFLGLFRTDADMADERIIHNDFYRIRYLYDVTYFWWFKASKEATTPCVFRPAIDVISKQPGEEAGVPAEGLVIIRRSMDGQRIVTGVGERYKHLLLQERSFSKMLADMLIGMEDKQRLAFMDPGSKEYVEHMTQMLQRTKKIHDAASGRSGGDGFGLGAPYAQEMYGAEDTTPSPGGEEGLWKLG
jgi:hypothetical protein